MNHLKLTIIRFFLAFVILTCSSLSSFAQTWSAQTTGTTQNLVSIFFIDANNGWSVGHGGTILRTTNGGLSWSSQSSGITTALYDIFFTDINNGWSVGDFGRVLRTVNGGTTWTIVSTFNDINQLFFSVHFTSALVGYIGGGDFNVGIPGLVYKTTNGGTSWTASGNLALDYIPELHFGDANTGYAAQESLNYGKLLKTTNAGASWTLLTFNSSPNTQAGESVFFIDANTGWLAGIAYSGGSPGFIYKTTNGGTTWTQQLVSGVNNGFWSIRFVDANTGWAVGLGGIIYYTSNGGTTWTIQPSGLTTQSINEIYSINASTAWVCADGGKILKYSAPVNAPPVANDDNGSALTEDGPNGTVNILTNDTDPDGNPTAPVNGVGQSTIDLDPSTVGLQTMFTDAQGVWTLNTATADLTFNPANNYNGTAVIPYTLCDPSGACDNANISFVVTPVNDLPVANDDNGSALTEDGPNGTVNILTNDTDPDGNPTTPVNGVGQSTIDLDPSTVGLQTMFTDAQGVWTLNTATADVTFNPANNYNGTAVIPYTLCDPSGACDNANISFVVTPVNDPPVANDDNGSALTEDGPNGTVNILTNDTDPDGNPTTPVNGVGQSTIDLDPSTVGLQTMFTDAQGVWTLNTATADLTFNPANNYNGTAVIPYTLCDPSGACDNANISFVVTPVNDPPVANDDNGPALTEDGPNGTVNILTNDTDPDGNPTAPVNGVGQSTIDLDPSTVGLQTMFTDAQGVWTLNTATADLTFDPANNYNGTAVIPYTLCDPSGACDNANISFLVHPCNTIILSSATGTNLQSVCVNTPITNITYLTSGATSATFNGLPNGIIGNWLSNMVTISGSPTITGSYTYTITLVGGFCNVSTTGIIIVKELSIAPVNISGVSTICNGGTTTLSLAGGSAGTGAIAEWFSGSCGGTPIGSGTSINVSPLTNTTYFVRYNGDCNITTCASVNVVVNQIYTDTTSLIKHGCYTWALNNTSYTLTGIYTVTYTSVNGCDSTKTLNLTIVPAVYLSGKVLLAGPYDVGLGLMHDSLRQQGLIPLLEPYSSSPYFKTPIGEIAGEMMDSTVLLSNGSNSIVDWVLLEVRNGTNPLLVIANKRALVQRDGDIVSVDGSSPLEFLSVPSGNYFISVKHRNHLGVMLQQTINLNGCSTAFVDFTNNNLIYSKPLLLNSPLKAIGTLHALWSGDANNNKNVKYNGLSSDKDFILTSLGGPANINSEISNVYRVEDINMDGKIKYNNINNDRVVILNNVGVLTPNQVLSQHTPN